ncbi:MAG: DUF5695 domain-containing protein [Vicinamibacterales bacterium]
MRRTLLVFNGAAGLAIAVGLAAVPARPAGQSAATAAGVATRPQSAGTAAIAQVGSAATIAQGADAAAIAQGGSAATIAQGADAAAIDRGDFRFDYDARGISSLANPHDPFGATLTAAGGGGRGRGRGNAAAPTLGLTVAYRTGDGAWTDVPRGDLAADPADGRVSYTSRGGPLQVTETYRTDGAALDWTIDLAATGRTPVEIGDLGIEIPVAGPSGATPAQIFERGFLKHQFIAGHGSFFFYMRASGAPPFLLVTVRPGTSLEYWTAGGRSGGRMFVHSKRTGGEETRGTWRQPHTSRTIPAGGRVSYGFRMEWASSYDALRDLLVRNGLFDVRVVPGMTVPEDLTARVSLHTTATVGALRAEFPDQTTIRRLGPPEVDPPPDHQVYEVTFRRLGENLLTIDHDGGRHTVLEFFVTEPLETLIRKRAAFLVNRQQIKDPSKWWDGVYGPYDARAGVVRTIDDPDIFLDRMVYALTCDDPGLAKAPFLAAKNAVFPDPKEIASLEYYIEHFVWGGLQRKDDERPYPYGIYGTPNWYVNRDPERRKDYAEHLANNATALRDLSREHVWRSYDYPHVVMLYFHMYEIAKRYPQYSTYLDATGYLTRAWETARAFYTYPYEIYPDYYDTYKWGLYNELVVLDLIDALRAEGYATQADWLRQEWEKKVKYFVYDDQYPFRSEYAFDRTAFESTYAFAKYGATHDMAPDDHLWFDLRLKTWYSHPLVRREDSRAFMDRQLASGLAVRGWLNPAYYTLGADPGVSYMAAMGGWGVLDYGLDFAPRPYDWLQLGYASYLSSWALMNTGRPDTNYGFWFPGAQNDGAAGWQFMSAKVGSAWMGSSYPGGVMEPRGPWHYDGEIDLGFGGALRSAATIVTRDPVFGWFAYGGAMTDRGDTLDVEPRDGLRRRFDVVIPDPGLPFAESVRRVKIEVDRDGFAAGEPITVAKALDRIAFTLENRTGDAHTTVIRLGAPNDGTWELRVGGEVVPLEPTGDWDYPWRASIARRPATVSVELRRVTSSRNPG